RWRSPPRTRERRTCAVARWCRAAPSPRSSCGPRSRARPSALEHREKRLLGDLDAAHLLHALLAFLLLLEQLALARDVAAIALGGDVLAHRLHRLARDDAAADGGLDGHLVQLPRDHAAQLLDERLAALVGLVTVDDGRERVDGDDGQKDIERHEDGRTEVD